MKTKKKTKRLFIVSDIHGVFLVAFSTRTKMNAWIAPFRKDSFIIKNVDVDSKSTWPKGMRPYVVQDTKPRAVFLNFGPPGVSRGLHVVGGVWTLECWARGKSHAIKQFEDARNRRALPKSLAYPKLDADSADVARE